MQELARSCEPAGAGGLLVPLSSDNNSSLLCSDDGQDIYIYIRGQFK